MALDAAIRQAYSRASTSTIGLLAVTLSHPLWPSTVRLTNYDEDVSVDGNLYVGHGLAAVEPEVGTEPSAALQIKVDGVSGTLNPLLAVANESDTPVQVTVKPYGLNTKTKSVIGVVGTFNLEVRSVNLDFASVVIECGHISPANQKFPSKRYNPDDYKNLYQ